MEYCHLSVKVQMINAYIYARVLSKFSKMMRIAVYFQIPESLGKLYNFQDIG